VIRVATAAGFNYVTPCAGVGVRIQPKKWTFDLDFFNKVDATLFTWLLLRQSPILNRQSTRDCCNWGGYHCSRLADAQAGCSAN